MSMRPFRAAISIALVVLAAVFCVPASFGAAADDWSEADAIVKRIVPPTFPAKDFLITDFGAVD